MIQPKDLRIGNYVYDEENEFCKISRLFSDKYIDYNDKYDEEYNVEYDNKDGIYLSKVINPIPLTEEILFKSNLEKVKDKQIWFLGHYGFCIEFIDSDEKNNWYLKTRIDEEYYIFCFEFLHHFQNIFYFITGQELEIKL